MLETSLLPSLKRPVLEQQSEAVTAALQSKRSLLDFQRNRIFREYDKARASNSLTAGPPWSPALRSEGRNSSSLCAEAAAEMLQHEVAGVLCPINGVPYVSLGTVGNLKVQLPQLQSRARAKSPIKYAHHTFALHWSSILVLLPCFTSCMQSCR